MSRALLLLALLASGCSLTGPSNADIEAARSPEADGVIVNRTSASFIPYAMDESNAALFDPASEFTVSDQDLIVASGDARALGITGYEPGETVIVYLFRVRGDVATYAGFQRIDGAEFERDDAVVTVNRF